MPEIRLLFDAGDAGLRVRLQSKGLPGLARSDPRPLRFSLADKAFEDVRWYLEEFMDLPDDGSRVRAERIEAELERWGRELFQEAFCGDAPAAMLGELLAAPEPRQLTIASDNVDVLRLPWELMADAVGPLFRRLTVRRQLESARDARPVAVELPLRMLLVVSRPDDLGFIDPRLTTRGLLDALKPLGIDNVQVDFCRPPTLAQLDEMLSDARRIRRPYAIVHFDGHGTYDPVLHLGKLCFEKPRLPGESGPVGTDPVTATRFGDLLSAYQIPLVILEACRSGRMDVAPLRSLAPRLIEAGVSSVVAMSHAVHVEAARVLLERFYRELVAGGTIGQALDLGRASLVTQPDRWIELGPGGRTVELHDWFLPQLYQRGDDLRLVPPGTIAPTGAAGETEPADTPAFDVFLSHNHASKPRVEKIAVALRDRGLRVWYDDWNVGREPIQLAVEKGIEASRFVMLCCTRKALESNWVEAERQMAYAKDPLGRNLLPMLLEDVAGQLPLGLKTVVYYDLQDAAQDETNVAKLAAAIGPSAAAPAPGGVQRRQPPARDELGAFPRPPIHRFQGRARELYELEREFRSHRAVLLHAMGGMGKTSLAREAAYWWTQTGLFPDGACFVSFEHGMTPEHVALVLGTYLEGPNFASLPQSDQFRRARKLFRDRRVLMVWDNFESVLPAFTTSPLPLAGEGSGVRAAANLDPSPTSPNPSSSPSSLPSLLTLFRDFTEDDSGHGRLLITCRPEETGLAGARHYELRGLSRPDSLHLLDRVMRKAGAAPDRPVDRDGLGRLAAVVSDHPLSLELIGPHLVKQSAGEIIPRIAELLGQFATDQSEVARNSSLLASLRFSTDQLSAAARAALPWLGLFQGGVFEMLLLDVSQIAPEAWESIRSELEATALIRVEDDLSSQMPYLRFHPTLSFAVGVLPAVGVPPLGGAAAAAEQRPGAASAEEPADVANPTVRQRFVVVYAQLTLALDKALSGSAARNAMEVLAREEPNFRRAVQWAVADGQFAVAQPMGDTFRQYLERGHRLREQDAWVQWLAEAAANAPWSESVANQERDAAWSLLAAGHADEALQRLAALIDRLERTTQFDPAFQLALARGDLGKALDAIGQAAQAIPILRGALRDWASLCRAAIAGSGSRETADAGPKGPDSCEVGSEGDDAFIDAVLRDPQQRNVCATELQNLAATLGDLANALMSAGQLGEALAVAERTVSINRDLGLHRELAVGLGQTAQILMFQGRYREADTRYEQALAAARLAGDRELQAATLQQQGGLAADQRQYSRATDLYRQALKLFQESGNELGVMLTCNLLGSVEHRQRRLAEARAWYGRSREMARGRKDAKALGIATQNLGIVCQHEGQAARAAGDETAAVGHFADAERFLRESLQMDLQLDNLPGEAQSQGQLGQLYCVMGRLEEAERHAQRAREIFEGLRDLRGLSITYLTLKLIARARGDEPAAAGWAAKAQAVDGELARRARGGDDAGPDPRLLELLAHLVVACVQSSAAKVPLPGPLAGVLAQLDSPAAGPLAPLGRYLRQLASAPAADLPGLLAAPPPGTPAPLVELLGKLREGL